LRVAPSIGSYLHQVAKKQATAVPVLDVRDISKSYFGTPVLADVTFTVEKAEVVALTGQNGSGKSTLLRCLIGREEPDSGTVMFDGAEFRETLPAFRAAVAAGMEPGDEFADLTVAEHLELMARAHGNPEPGELVRSVLAQLNLQKSADRFPFALSQGQRRRLGLASCLVRPRRLLVLDEPESNLDIQGRAWLADKILSEKADGVAVLFASHDPALVDQVADSVVELFVDIMEDTMEHGMAEDGTPPAVTT
jgi:ABC-2 type transport system ATP-binding protein